ncbi:hypothetical protein [Burkholderia gladioli]|uniref:hypothetical protein n=1 Tax=Burkholderia gladioli TaxID=28095 RepID=UPI003D1EC39F
MTYTCATLEVSERTFREIEAKLRAAGYDHAFDEAGMIDMTHIGLVIEPTPTGPVCTCERTGQADCEVHAA